MFPIPPTISANTQELAMIAAQRKQKMEQRVATVMEQGNQAHNNLHTLMIKAQSFPQIDLNPLTQQDEFRAYLTKIDLICLFLEDFNFQYRNFMIANSLDTPPRQEMAVTHQSSPVVIRAMLEGPPIRVVNNYPIYPPHAIMHGSMYPVHRFHGPNVRPPIFPVHPPCFPAVNCAGNSNNHPASARPNSPVRANAKEFVPAKSASVHCFTPQAKPVQSSPPQGSYAPGISSSDINQVASPSPQALQVGAPQATQLKTLPSPQAWPMGAPQGTQRPDSPSPQALSMGAPQGTQPQMSPSPQALHMDTPQVIRPQSSPTPQAMHTGVPLQPIALHTGQQSRPSHPSRHKKQNDMLLDLSSQSSIDIPEESVAPVPTSQAPGHRQSAASAAPLLEPMQNKRKMGALEAALAESMVDENDPTVSGLPSQEVLEIDAEYDCVLTYKGTPSEFYIVVNPIDHIGLLIARLTHSMEEYYTQHQVDVRPLLDSMSYCAVNEGSEWFRCFIVDAQSEDSLQVYFVDYGGVEVVPIETVQPLVPRFCEKAPYARVCHLTGVEPTCGEWSEEAIRMLSELHCSVLLKVTVDDNSSESLGVTLYQPQDLVSINQQLINKGLAVANTSPRPSPPFSSSPLQFPLVDTPRNPSAADLPSSRVPVAASSLVREVPTRDLSERAPPTPESANASFGLGSVPHAPSPQQLGSTDDSAQLDQWNILDCPEYNDPLMAVQGYSNRDEAEICKFYKGPPHTACFKGANCKKKHITMHPDGWTRDKVEVTRKPEPLTLPTEGARLPVYVTCVDSFRRFYVQLPDLDASKEKQNELLPAALRNLIRKMNSVSVVQSIASLPMMPSPGELVAAWYPDKKLYRAQVLQVEQDTLRVQIYYVDFGNTAWTLLSQVYELEAQFALLPFQAVPCFLADIALKNNIVDKIQAMEVIKGHILEKRLLANVIGMASADTLLVELEDAGGFSVAETVVIQHARLFHHRPDSRGSATPAQTKPNKDKVVHLPG